MTELTQHQKILNVMCRDKTGQWFYPYDFMKSNMGDNFVGYEASARLSELGKDYPDIFESERDGKYIRRRLRFDTLAQWLPLLPKDLRYIIHRAGLTGEIKRSRASVSDPQTGKPVSAGTILKRAKVIPKEQRRLI